ncbi:hypothetical protein B566_EDAN007953 [Ephemera danica]|nr:hypothetical protein B566_EDAN007953 [Ephemera danica]
MDKTRAAKIGIEQKDKKVSKPEELKIFNASELQSDLPFLSELYPGGFDTLQTSECEVNISLLIVVHSAMPHSKQRQAIRESWGASTALPSQVRLVFLVAKGANGETAADTHIGDVISANFIDSYRNLTLKSVAMLDWVTQNCPNIQFLLKCDDDVFVNIHNLLTELNLINYQSDAIIGKIASGWKPIRNEASKYFMSVAEFAPSILPNFTTGPAYIITGPLVPSLFEAALAEHWLTLEDVFITGLVGGFRLNVELINWPMVLNSRATLTVCNAHRLFSIHNVRPKEQARLLRLSKLSQVSCKIREERQEKAKLKQIEKHK